LVPVSGHWATLASLPRHKGRSEGRLRAPSPRTAGGRSPRSEPRQLVGDYANPILKPWAAEVVKTFGEISLAFVAYPSSSNQCWPGGVPYVFLNFGMQILQQPDKIVILYDEDHEVRRIRMNQPHPANVTPSWYGDSVGHLRVIRS
jgi:hypothetical protein